MMDWLHQTRGVRETLRRIDAGEDHLCVTSPTGGGKTRMMLRLIEHFGRTVVYVNRSMLFDQFCETLAARGFDFGTQAAGYAEDLAAPVQVASVQTVSSRWSKGKMNLHDADLVIVDELHNEAQHRMCSLIEAHVAAGAKFVGFTATPIEIEHIVDVLIQAGTTSELRRCGALVPATIYAPDEVSMKAFTSPSSNILLLRKKHKAAVIHSLFGRVVEHYHLLNPDRRPAILFAPGVPESQWFAKSLCDQGVRAAHIDGAKIWINGEAMLSNRETREALRRKSESGEVEVVCNRFVLREGIDWPHLYHGIFACSFGSVSAFLQAGGRLLRAHDSLDRVVIQDHGGNWWRHDSLNADRIWELGDTERSLKARHERKYRTKAATEPVVCPKCKMIRRGGAECLRCGHVSPGKTRMVIQTNGRLASVTGDIYKARRVPTSPQAHRDWLSCYFRAKKSKRGLTFNQAIALWQTDFDHYGEAPDATFPCFPKDFGDLHMKVRDVPFGRLTPYSNPTKPETVDSP